MLDFTNFSSQYPDPDKDQVLRMLEEAKLILIEELSLRSVDNGSELQPVSVGSDPEYLATYVQALVRVHEEMIPILQRLVPPQFSDLVKNELSHWIPSPGVKK